ncbi:MAG: GMC family oxidoreductase N-terminal domain-containing protein, partial [Myxococcota bacterium]|nr:GMC family oxidoreductase N-terminal domain-containing protein [Myxococcota bacterium]
MTWVWIGVPVLVAVLTYVRLFAGYGAPGRQLEHLRPWSHAFTSAAGDTLFPAGGALPPSAADVDVVGYLDDWMGRLPRQQRTLIKLLFLMLEQAPLLALSPRRFSGLPREARERVFATWEGSRLYYRRSILAGLRTVFSFAYLDHPKVHEALGIADRKACQPIPTTHLTPDELGEGKLLDLADHDPDVRVECDVVVVGTGAGGAVAAQVLAEAGLDVVILEEGPLVRPEDVSRNCGIGMTQILHEGGMRTMIGPTATPTMQGRCVGGSTLPNSAILFRFPDPVLDRWRDEFGVEGIDNRVLAASYDRVEGATDKAQARPEQLGPKNLLFARGAEAMGIDAEP